MSAPITTDQVWKEVEKQIFAVLGMVTAKGEARTVGIVYAVRDRHIYITSGKDAWKTKYIEQNPHVSLTVTIPKRIPFLPWIHIPAATITFQGEASLLGVEDVEPEIRKKLLKGLEIDDEFIANTSVIRVQPRGHFLTYGVGVSLLTMRKPQEAGGRVPV
jgi:hypothetical protein